MSRFRKKPVEIEATQFVREVGGRDNSAYLSNWCGGRIRCGHHHGGTDHDVWMEIPTLEGNMHARPGDWIIKGVQGEFYPCKPDIFAATYEVVES